MSTARATMKHAAIYSGAAMAGRLISFIMLPFYAHILRGHGYAVIGMLDVGLGFLQSLLVHGLQSAIVRLYHDEKDPARKPVVITTGVILIGGVAGLLVIPMIIFSRPIAGFLIDDPSLNHLVIMALIAFNFDLMGQAASSWLLIRSRSVLLVGLGLIRLFFGLSLNIYLVLIKGMGLDGFFISALVVSITGSLILVAIVFHDCGPRFDREIACRIRDFLSPLIPGSLASWLGRQAERILAKTMISLDSVGILEMGYKFPMLISILVSRPFIQSWETRRFEIADEPGAPQTISRMFTSFMFLMIWVGLVMALVIKPLLVFLTPPEFHIAYRIARVEIVTIILQGAYYHLMFGLAYAKATPMLSKLRIGTTGIKLPLSWLFISTWGIFGAAYSAAVTSLISAVLVFHFSQKKYYLRLEWRTLSVLVGVALGIFLWLDNWDLWSTGLFHTLDRQVLPSLAGLIEKTFLGTWKEGKLIVALNERSAVVAEMLIKGTLAMGYVMVLPAIHPPTRQRWMRQLRTRLGALKARLP